MFPTQTSILVRLFARAGTGWSDLKKSSTLATVSSPPMLI